MAESNGRPLGLVALSWIDEEKYYGQFPGETWKGKTWLEQNRIVAKTKNAYHELLAALPFRTHLRYLSPDTAWQSTKEDLAVDETGYLFFPPMYQYCIDNYLSQFKGKTRKRLLRELSCLESQGLTYRFDQLADFEQLVRLNVEAFGEHSYFSDPRFLHSFESLVEWLYNQKLLRIVTVLIGNRVAAVDMGAVFREEYTVLAGGTAAEFPGVAKHINLTHLRWACENRIALVDFLCGDFNWKSRFHLQPRPLYLIDSASMRPVEQIASGI